MGESLLQELKSPWELILTEPVLQEVEFRPANWAENYFSAHSAMRSSRVTLFSEKKIFNEAEEIASLNMGARNQYSSINILGEFIVSKS